MARKPVVFVVGSTASGKSEWALRWAQKWGGVIVNCDSVQVYKKVDIGAAKPTAVEQALVPHFLLDYITPPQESTAGSYCRDFFECIENIAEDIPIFVVGGTGFYFMAIEKGMYPVIPVAEELKIQIQEELKEPSGPERLLAELRDKDPEYGAKIHISDLYRLGRAIELIRSQNKSVTEIQQEMEIRRKPFPYPLLKIGPLWEREKLKKRIEERTDKMLAMGLVDEVRGLLDEGLENWAPLSSVGYKETISFIRGQISEQKLREDIAQNTRQLAKRQRTWFQRDKDIRWFDGEKGFAEASDLVEKFLNPFDPTRGKA